MMLTLVKAMACGTRLASQKENPGLTFHIPTHSVHGMKRCSELLRASAHELKALVGEYVLSA